MERLYAPEQTRPCVVWPVPGAIRSMRPKLRLTKEQLEDLLQSVKGMAPECGYLICS